MTAIEIMRQNEAATKYLEKLLQSDFRKMDDIREEKRAGCPYHSVYYEMGQKYDMCSKNGMFCDCNC